jgi:hypothetical protein
VISPIVIDLEEGTPFRLTAYHLEQKVHRLLLNVAGFELRPVVGADGELEYEVTATNIV